MRAESTNASEQLARTEREHSYSLGVLRQQAADRAEELGAARAKLDLVERALFVAEEKVKAMAGAEAEREARAARLRESRAEFEADARRSWTEKEARFLEALEEREEALGGSRAEVVRLEAALSEQTLRATQMAARTEAAEEEGADRARRRQEEAERMAAEHARELERIKANTVLQLEDERKRGDEERARYVLKIMRTNLFCKIFMHYKVFGAINSRPELLD